MSVFTSKYLNNVRNENTNTITGLKSLTNNMNSEIIRMNNEIDNLSTSLSTLDNLVDSLNTSLTTLQNDTSLQALEMIVNSNTSSLYSLNSSLTSLSSTVSNNSNSINSLNSSLTSLSSTVSNIPQFEIINDLTNPGTTKLLQSEALKSLIEMIVKSFDNGILENDLISFAIYDWVKILGSDNDYTIQKDNKGIDTITKLNAITFAENRTINNLVISHDVATNLSSLSSVNNLIVASTTELTELENNLSGVNISGVKLWSGIESTPILSTINLSSSTCQNIYMNITNFNLPSNLSIINFKGGNQLTKINTNAFKNCSNLEDVDIPEGTRCYTNAFESCTSLTNINLPKLITLDSYAFYKCSSLASINLPNCTYIYFNAFDSCTNLTNINLSNCTYIDNYAFNKCKSLTLINILNCNTIGNGCFCDCSKLTTIDISNVYNIGNYPFLGCKGLNELHIGVLTSCGTAIFGALSQSINIYIHTTNLTDATNTATTLNTNKGETVSLIFYYNPDEWTQITL